MPLTLWLWPTSFSALSSQPTLLEFDGFLLFSKNSTDISFGLLDLLAMTPGVECSEIIFLSLAFITKVLPF